MNRFNYLFMLIGVLCGSFMWTASHAVAAEPSYPIGINSPSQVVNGLYPGTDAGNCCWMGQSAVIKVAVPKGADTLLLNVLIPDYAASRSGQSLRVQIDNSPVQERCCLGAGEHELTFALRGDKHVAAIRLWAGSTFVPKAVGLNDDPRHLSVLLRAVSFQNSVTGEQFASSAAPWMPGRVALLLLAAAAALIFALTLRRPIYGVAALILTDPFLLAFTIHGTSITLPKVALLAVAAGIAPRLRSARLGLALGLLGAAQLLFALTMIPASLHAPAHADALREALKALEYVITLLVAYLAYRLDPDEHAARVCLSIVTIAVALLALAQPIARIGESETIAGHTLARIAGPLEGPNQLAGFLGVVVPAMLAFAILRAPVTIERAAIALGTLACLLTFSRGGIAALALGIAVVLVVRYERSWRRVTGVALFAAFTAFLTLAFGVFAGTLHGHAQSLFGPTGDGAFNGGLGTRVDLWHGAYALWRTHPLFGIGAGNFEHRIGLYYPGVRTHANSMYFQALAEQGVAGLLAAFAVVAASIGVFIRRLRQPLALAACAASVAMAFHQIVDCMWVYPKVGVIWWVLLALGAAAIDLRSPAEDLAEPAVA